MIDSYVPRFMITLFDFGFYGNRHELLDSYGMTVFYMIIVI